MIRNLPMKLFSSSFCIILVSSSTSVECFLLIFFRAQYVLLSLCLTSSTFPKPPSPRVACVLKSFTLKSFPGSVRRLFSAFSAFIAFYWENLATHKIVQKALANIIIIKLFPQIVVLAARSQSVSGRQLVVQHRYDQLQGRLLLTRPVKRGHFETNGNFRNLAHFPEQMLVERQRRQ